MVTWFSHAAVHAKIPDDWLPRALAHVAEILVESEENHYAACILMAREIDEPEADLGCSISSSWERIYSVSHGITQSCTEPAVSTSLWIEIITVLPHRGAA